MSIKTKIIVFILSTIFSIAVYTIPVSAAKEDLVIGIIQEIVDEAQYEQQKTNNLTLSDFTEVSKMISEYLFTTYNAAASPAMVTTEAIVTVDVIEEPAQCNEEIDIDFLAKLIWAEGGTMSWEGQVYLCSAILNLCDMTGRSVWSAGHDYNMFSVAYIVDYVSPTQTQYDVIEYVLNGGRIADVCYFRTDFFHSFGTPVCSIDNVYFSAP